MEQTNIQLPVTESGVTATHTVQLTSSEIANLWRTYMHYSMIAVIQKYFLKHLEDVDIRPLIEEALAISETRVRLATEFLSKDGQPIPAGFGNEDVDLDAPRLYADIFYLYYLKNMIKVELNINSMAVTMAARLDIIDFYSKSVDYTLRLWNKVARVMLEKGLFIRAPFITTTGKVDFVKKQDFLSGFLNERRPLLAIEIEQLFFGIITNEVGRTLLTGFRQVIRSEQARKYIDRGIDISAKIIENFGATMRKEGITSPMHWDAYGTVTYSTTPPFSDKLIMFHLVSLNTIGIANFAVGISQSPRHDLALMYGRMMTEIANYAEDGINIMIDNGWFEEPPRYIDRRELVNEQKH